MANDSNLQPVQTKEEARERGRNGGIKSGEVRREKKLFKEAIERKLGASIDSIISAMIAKASDGDVSASTFLRDTIGEKPTDKVQADVNTDITINVGLSDD